MRLILRSENPFACKAWNYAGPPAFLLLATVDQFADFPIKPDQLGIDRQHGARLSEANALLDVGEQSGIADG
jgi:hypothetical protein